MSSSKDSAVPTIARLPSTPHPNSAAAAKRPTLRTPPSPAFSTSSNSDGGTSGTGGGTPLSPLSSTPGTPCTPGATRRQKNKFKSPECLQALLDPQYQNTPAGASKADTYDTTPYQANLLFNDNSETLITEVSKDDPDSDVLKIIQMSLQQQAGQPGQAGHNPQTFTTKINPKTGDVSSNNINFILKFIESLKPGETQILTVHGDATNSAEVVKYADFIFRIQAHMQSKGLDMSLVQIPGLSHPSISNFMKAVLAEYNTKRAATGSASFKQQNPSQQQQQNPLQQQQQNPLHSSGSQPPAFATPIAARARKSGAGAKKPHGDESNAASSNGL